MEKKNMPLPPKRPVPQRRNVQKDENLKALAGEEIEENQAYDNNITEGDEVEKKDAGQSKDMLFGVLGGVSLILAIISFVLMFVL